MFTGFLVIERSGIWQESLESELIGIMYVLLILPINIFIQYFSKQYEEY